MVQAQDHLGGRWPRARAGVWLMAEHGPWFSIDTHSSATLQRGALSLTPQTQIVTLRTPLGTWRWVRPEALLVQGPQGLQRLPIHDETRLAWAACWALALGCVALFRIKTRQPKEKTTHDGRH